VCNTHHILLYDGTGIQFWGKDLEKIVLSRAVQKHIERKVLAYKNKTVIFN
jgi:formyltetrahydrofolate hydrolase